MKLVSDFVQLSIPPKPEYIGIVRLAIAGIASRMKLDYEDIEDLKLASSEACNCIINSSQNIAKIKVLYKLEGKKITISISEVKKNGLSKDKKDFKKDFPCLNDMGIFLIKALMDEVKCKITENKKKFIWMSKNFYHHLNPGDNNEKQK